MIKSLLQRSLPRTDWGDSVYAFCAHLRRRRRWPRWRNPKRFNDHLYRLKVDGSLQDPLSVFATDKEYAKYYIAAVVGWEHVVETYRILRDKDAVDRLILERLPCVIKPTHLCGHVEFLVDDTQPLPRDVMKSWFDINYYRKSREQNYRGLRPKIIVEEFVSEDGRTVPNDYKIYCFSGIPKLIHVESDQLSNHSQTFYDIFWNKLPITLEYPGASYTHSKPAILDKMLDLAARLSSAFSFVRVDMYIGQGERIRIGELDFCPHSAGGWFHPQTAEEMLGRLFESGRLPETVT